MFHVGDSKVDKDYKEKFIDVYVAMAKILILARLTAQSGNLTTAERIKGHLTETGHTCELQTTEFFESNEDCKNYIIENEFCCVVGIHLWRAGKLLLGCPVPFSIVFGGTDLNKHVEDGMKFHVMTQVAENAKNLVAFSQTMACKAEYLWPNVKPKLIVQPQAVVTCSSENFTETNLVCKMKECVTANGNESLFLKSVLHGTLILFLVVAGLRPVKDPMFLFEIISEWHKQDSRVFLVVVGPEVYYDIEGISTIKWIESLVTCGEYNDLIIDFEFSMKVKETAKKYPGVVVLPALSQADLHAAIKHFVVAVVNTSVSEGMAACILEAMDLNTVVLARKIPGNEYLINHNENGLLFQTPEEFLSLARQVAYDEKYRNRLALGGKTYISNNHSLSLEKETYKSIVRMLMK